MQAFSNLPHVGQGNSHEMPLRIVARIFRRGLVAEVHRRQPGIYDPSRVPAINQRSVTYAPDRVNPAPNIGIAWNPRGGKTVIRASYGISYFDEGLNVDYWVNTNAGNWRSVSAAPGTEYTPGGLSFQSSDPAFLVAPASFNPPFGERQFAFQN